ncbi:MAG: R3H domain-containing nucleic acid-binding protein [bacterium]
MTKEEKQIEAKITQRLIDICNLFGVVPKITAAIDDNILTMDVETGRDDLFVGRSADPMLALQHLIRLIAHRDFPESELSVSINIGGFHQQQRSRLAEVAQNAAAQARSTGTAVYLPPMSSFERRLIHLALVEETGVMSESTGVGPSRRVVVKLAK